MEGIQYVDSFQRCFRLWKIRQTYIDTLQLANINNRYYIPTFQMGTLWNPTKSLLFLMTQRIFRHYVRIRTRRLNVELYLAIPSTRKDVWDLYTLLRSKLFSKYHIPPNFKPNAKLYDFEAAARQAQLIIAAVVRMAKRRFTPEEVIEMVRERKPALIPTHYRQARRNSMHLVPFADLRHSVAAEDKDDGDELILGSQVDESGDIEEQFLNFSRSIQRHGLLSAVATDDTDQRRLSVSVSLRQTSHYGTTEAARLYRQLFFNSVDYVGLFRVNRPAQTEETSVGSVKEVRRMFEDLILDIEEAKDQLGAALEDDVHAVVTSLSEHMRVRLESLKRSHDMDVSRVRRAYRARLADCIAQITFDAEVSDCARVSTAHFRIGKADTSSRKTGRAS
nr:hypothetical protein HK105_006055 [Polyrhizophydium stewartii]